MLYSFRVVFCLTNVPLDWIFQGEKSGGRFRSVLIPLPDGNGFSGGDRGFMKTSHGDSWF